MVYYSQAWQDEFVANLLGFKRNGYFLDIGSTDGMNQSNSYFFETELGWNGVCVERGIGYTEHYKKNRRCVFLNEDATAIDYKTLLNNLKYPNRIDFLSVDIDENTVRCLKQLPLNDFRFSVIAIEHDAYRFGDSLRSEEREILKNNNYHLLFSNVLVPLGCGMGPDLPFEDWWVDLSVFNVDKLSALVVKLAADKLYPDHIVATLKSMPDRYVV